jgi:PKD repeat protein
MVPSIIRRAAVTFALLASAGCTIHSTETPAVSGPSTIALSLNLNAIPDSISQDGGSQSSIKITAIGPSGKGQAAVPLRIDTRLNGVPQDYGTLSARTIVTNGDGVATVVYTAPPSPAGGVFGTCGSLVGTCVEIIATPTGTGFETAVSQSVQIRLVPLGVILPPASTPTAVFNYSPSTVSANLPIQFDASTSQPGQGASQIVTYNWTFGDGTNATGKNVTHTYSAGNNFAVTLIVTNDRGLSASTTQQLAVSAGALPTPLFTVSPAAPGVNERVFFNGSTSTPGTGHSSITAYRWTFGDGATGSGVTVSHAYAAAGTYGVQLTVTDEVGQSNTSTSTQVTVGNPPAPTSNFTFAPLIASLHQSVVFDASTSSTAQGQTIVDYAWNFGDGTPVVHSTTRTISHAFTVAGTIAVNLVVTDSAGRTGSKSNTIVVNGSSDPTAPLANFTVTPQPGAVNQEMSFVSTTTLGSTGAVIVNHQWNFGDGTAVFSTGTTSNVGYTYRRAGSFTASLTVTDASGRTATATKTVLVQ